MDSKESGKTVLLQLKENPQDRQAVNLSSCLYERKKRHAIDVVKCSDNLNNQPMTGRKILEKELINPQCWENPKC